MFIFFRFLTYLLSVFCFCFQQIGKLTKPIPNRHLRKARSTALPATEANASGGTAKKRPDKSYAPGRQKHSSGPPKA